MKSGAPIPVFRVASMPVPGQLVNERYTLKEVIGRGGVGIVFKAIDETNNQKVALKILIPEVIDQPTIVERFRREAKLSSALTSPHTVHIHGYGVYAEAEGVIGLPFIAMEYLHGLDLEAYLDLVPTLPLAEALSVMEQCLLSLEEAHRLNIIHRDIKPQNIFLAGRSGQGAKIKVLDFGIAKGISDPGTDEISGHERLTETGLVCGTPQFMAPEQAEGKRDLKAAVDVYNLACVLFKMLTGKLLYEGATPFDVAYQHVMAPIPPFPPSLEETPVADLLRRALAKDPDERLPDASAFLIELNEVVKACETKPKPPLMPIGLPDPEPELPTPATAKPTQNSTKKGLAMVLVMLVLSAFAMVVTGLALWYFVIR